MGALMIGSCQKEYVTPKPSTPPPPPGSIKFSADIVPIFITNCAKSGCHDATTDKAGLNLSTAATAYEDLFDNSEIDTTNLPSSAATSNLYIRMTSTNTPMPPLSAGGKLSSTETDKVLTWIKAGAKNN